MGGRTVSHFPVGPHLSGASNSRTFATKYHLVAFTCRHFQSLPSLSRTCAHRLRTHALRCVFTRTKSDPVESHVVLHSCSFPQQSEACDSWPALLRIDGLPTLNCSSLLVEHTQHLLFFEASTHSETSKPPSLLRRSTHFCGSAPSPSSPQPREQHDLPEERIHITSAQYCTLAFSTEMASTGTVALLRALLVYMTLLASVHSLPVSDITQSSLSEAITDFPPPSPSSQSMDQPKSPASPLTSLRRPTI